MQSQQDKMILREELWSAMREMELSKRGQVVDAFARYAFDGEESDFRLLQKVFYLEMVRQHRRRTLHNVAKRRKGHGE